MCSEILILTVALCVLASDSVSWRDCRNARRLPPPTADRLAAHARPPQEAVATSRVPPSPRCVRRQIGELLTLPRCHPSLQSALRRTRYRRCRSVASRWTTHSCRLQPTHHSGDPALALLHRRAHTPSACEHSARIRPQSLSGTSGRRDLNLRPKKSDLNTCRMPVFTWGDRLQISPTRDL